MAATITGTPAAITWAAGSNPAGQTVTIPTDATAVYMFWSYWNATGGSGLLSVTLAGNAQSQEFEIATTGNEAATGVAAWYNPATGDQTLDPAWDASPTEGSTCIVAYVKDGDTIGWRDADAANELGATAVTVTLTTVSDDLVIKYDQRFSGTNVPPGTSAGWTSAQTHGNNSEGARMSRISATGTTQVCDSEDENYSTICAIAIPAATAGHPVMRRWGAVPHMIPGRSFLAG